MIQKTTLTFILLALTFIACSDINKFFYKDAISGTVYTEAEYIKYKQTKSLKFQKTNTSFKEYIIEEYKSKDSVIKIFKLNQITKSIKIISKKNKEKIYSLIGTELPKGKLKLLDGKNYNLGINNDKPTFVNIWYTTCVPCVAEIAFLNEIKNEYKNRINFIAITFEPKEIVEKFLKRKPFNFIQIIESKEFLRELGVKMYPKSIFIDNSNIIKEVEGALIMNQINTESKKLEFKKRLDKLLQF
jgi:thiol-disulfide isomerase/thioredoxin